MSRITVQKKADFLGALAAGETARDAAALTGIPRQYYYQLRQTDADFDRAWRDAYEEGTEALEGEAIRRGRDGVERRKPIVYRGAVVKEAVYREFSDTLLMFVMKARNPGRYRENTKHEVSGIVEHDHQHKVAVDDDQLERLASIAGILGSIGVLGSGRPGALDEAVDAEAYEVHPPDTVAEASRLPPA